MYNNNNIYILKYEAPDNSEKRRPFFARVAGAPGPRAYTALQSRHRSTAIAYEAIHTRRDTRYRRHAALVHEPYTSNGYKVVLTDHVLFADYLKREMDNIGFDYFVVKPGDRDGSRQVSKPLRTAWYDNNDITVVVVVIVIIYRRRRCSLAFCVFRPRGDEMCAARTKTACRGQDIGTTSERKREDREWDE